MNAGWENPLCTDIYGCRCSSGKHYVTGEDALISLAGPANKQGRIIADNICGGDSRYLGSQEAPLSKYLI